MKVVNWYGLKDKINESKTVLTDISLTDSLVQQLSRGHWIKMMAIHGLSISGMIAWDVPERYFGKARINRAR